MAPLEFKSKEQFIDEVYNYMKLNDSTLLEAIVEYQKKYDLDEEYITKNLFTPSIYDNLKIEANHYNLIKKEETDEMLTGV